MIMFSTIPAEEYCYVFEQLEAKVKVGIIIIINNYTRKWQTTSPQTKLNPLKAKFFV